MFLQRCAEMDNLSTDRNQWYLHRLIDGCPTINVGSKWFNTDFIAEAMESGFDWRSASVELTFRGCVKENRALS